MHHSPGLTRSAGIAFLSTVLSRIRFLSDFICG